MMMSLTVLAYVTYDKMHKTVHPEYDVKSDEELQKMIEERMNMCNVSRDCEWSLENNLGFVARFKHACINNTCTEVECLHNRQCLGKLEICASNYTCVQVDCKHDRDCYRVSDVCMNNTCIHFDELCEQIAKSDYNMTMPQCTYTKRYNSCDCKDKIITIPRQKIVNNNSITIIEEVHHFIHQMTFYPKQEAIDRFVEACLEND